jgi:hypothetical protein
MVEGNNLQIEGNFNEPSEYVSAMRSVYPEKDLKEHFIDYSIKMSEDSINSFYGGTLAFDEDDDGLVYNEEDSKEHIEKVNNRFSWLLEFEYTPIEIKEEVEKFLEVFKEVNPSSPKEWTELVNRWVKIIRPLANNIREKRKGEEPNSF